MSNTSDKSKEKQSIQLVVTAAAIIAISAITCMISYSMMLFSGPCPDFVGSGIALFLLAGAIGTTLYSLGASYPGIYGSIQDIPVAIGAVMGVAIAASMPDAGQEVVFSNIFVAIALSTVFTGIAFFLLGYFKLGNIVRYVPYPVVGGVLAGTGWLLIKGGMQVSTGVGFKMANVATFFQTADMLQLGCAAVFSLCLIILGKRFPSNNFIMPGVIALSIGGFLVAWNLTGATSAELKSQGWLIASLPQEALWQSLTLPNLADVNWLLVFKQAGSISTIVVLAVVSFLLNETGVEFVAGGDFDINKDLYVSGGINLLTAPLGAPASFIYLGSTTLATNMGVRSRLMGPMISVAILVTLLFGAGFLSVFPNFISGGILLFLGLSIISEWVFDVRKTIPTIDFLIICTIVVVVETVGFLEAVGVGLLASVVIFTVRYSAISVVKNTLFGSDVSSNKGRTIVDEKILEHNPRRIMMLELDGFIFFGSANKLYERIKDTMVLNSGVVQHMLFDMRLVQGIDSSAMTSLKKMALFLEEESVAMYIVGLDDDVAKLLQLGGVSSEVLKSLTYMESMDNAIEFCEDSVIRFAKEQIALGEQSDSSVDLLHTSYDEMVAALDMQERFEILVGKLKPHLETREVKAGKHLYEQGDSTDDMFFIMRGQVTLSRLSSNNKPVRIRTLGPWSITGELAAFLGHGAPYSATVTQDVKMHVLTGPQRKEIEQSQPEVAAMLQQLIIVMLGNQVAKTSKSVALDVT